MKNNMVTITKVNVEEFIAVLEQLSERGAIYVDIVAELKEHQDTLSLIVRDNYIDPDNNQFDDVPSPPPAKLSDDILNDLLN